MQNTLGYVLTWSTYGTWLQGEEKGFVKDGKVLGEKIALKKDCVKKLKGTPSRLGRKEKTIVREAILAAGRKLQQKILAAAVYSNHVHIVCEYVDVPISVVVGRYKAAARVALKEHGFAGRLWTRGYDKRFCFEQKALKQMTDYVQRHESEK